MHIGLKEAAEILGQSRPATYRLMRSGAFGEPRKDGRRWVVRRDQVLSFQAMEPEDQDQYRQTTSETGSVRELLRAVLDRLDRIERLLMNSANSSDPLRQFDEKAAALEANLKATKNNLKATKKRLAKQAPTAEGIPTPEQVQEFLERIAPFSANVKGRGKKPTARSIANWLLGARGEHVELYANGKRSLPKARETGPRILKLLALDDVELERLVAAEYGANYISA